jgi:tRNA(fMet)-specific endonuclease VapC
MYILDTDHLSLLGRADSPEAQRLRFRLAGVDVEERVTTIITFEEQMRGWMAHLARARLLARQVEAYRRLKEFLDRYLKVTVLEFDEAAAVEFGRLQGLHLRVGTMDLKIAAIALAHKATVLTRNVKDFGLVTGLRVEDWTKSLVE